MSLLQKSDILFCSGIIYIYSSIKDCKVKLSFFSMGPHTKKGKFYILLSHIHNVISRVTSSALLV